MIHDIDLLLWLSGSGIAKIDGFGSRLLSPTLDTADLLLTLTDGRRARVSASRVSARPQRALRVIEAARIWDAETGLLSVDAVTHAPDAAEGFGIARRNVTKVDALQAETDAFLAAVRGDSPLVVSGEDGLRALEAIEQIETVLRSGKPMSSVMIVAAEASSAIFAQRLLEFWRDEGPQG